MHISGSTRFIAHIGYPTTTFRAPMIYNPYFRHRGIDVVVVPMGCRADGFAGLISALRQTTNCLGALVTMPNKLLAVELADEVATTARICGSANALRFAEDGRMLADMFDGEGFARGLERKGRQLRGASVFIAGAGGVGSAIAASLAGRGVRRIDIMDTSEQRMRSLAGRLASAYPDVELNTGLPELSAFDIVVNATPVGMSAGDPLPFDIGAVAPTAIVGDVVLGTAMTPLLLAARERGCEVQVGLDMLFEQIPAYLEFFDLPTTTPEELRALAEVPDL